MGFQGLSDLFRHIWHSRKINNFDLSHNLKNASASIFDFHHVSSHFVNAGTVCMARQAPDVTVVQLC